MRFAKRKAFTLVELLIVIAVIGILFIVLVSRVDFATDKARITGAQNDIHTIQYAVHQVAIEDGQLVDDLSRLAFNLNKNLDTELVVRVEGNMLKTHATDPWGNEYQLRYNNGADNKGQVQILSAGPDQKYVTEDDIIVAIICKISASGTDVVVKNDVASNEIIRENGTLPNQPEAPGHVCSFNRRIQSTQFLKTAGNCKTESIYFYSCECGAIGTATFTGSKNPSEHVANPTITYNSYNDEQHTTVTTCVGCNIVLNTNNETHTFNNNVCTKCRHERHLHSYVIESAIEANKATSATCSVPATYYYTCACGAKSTNTFAGGNTIAHNYTGHVTIEPTCTTTGVRTYTCLSCGDSRIEQVDMVSHNFNQRAESTDALKTPATCKDYAVYYYSCSSCNTPNKNGSTFNGSVLADHSGGTNMQYEYIDESKHYVYEVCNTCNQTLLTTTSVHGNLVNNKCSSCKGHVHSFTRKVENDTTRITNATCTTYATYRYSCADTTCNALGDINNPFSGNQYAAHIEVNGKTENVHTKCSVCGTTISSTHSYSTPVITKDATCTSTGTQEKTCTCGYAKAESVTALGHDIVSHSAKTATCTSIGWNAYDTCNRCNYTTYKEIAMLGHVEEFGGTVDCHVLCTVCGNINNVHVYSTQIIVAATCQIVGQQQKTCTCGYSYYEEISKSNHLDSNNDGICDVCNVRVGYAANTLVFKSDGIAYYYGSNNSVRGTYTGWMDSIYTTVTDQPWYSIADSIKAVVVEDDVSPISTAYWFYGCSGLETVVFGNNVTTIGLYTCGYASSLKTLTIGEAVSTIEGSAFSTCKNLESINFNAINITNEIQESTFTSCGRNSSNGITLTIGNKVTHIPNGMFTHGSDKMIMGNNVTIYTMNITKLIFEEGSVCTSIGDDAFAYNENLQFDSLPNTLTHIGARAFQECTNLKYIHIPEQVLTIGKGAFDNCKRVTQIDYNAINCSDFSSINNVFSDVGKSSTGIHVYIGENVMRLPAYLFTPDFEPSYPYIISITFQGNQVKEIGHYAFAHVRTLTSIIIPESVTSIGNYAFASCYGLTQITIHENIQTIGNLAFSHCKNLTHIYFNAISANGWTSSNPPFAYTAQESGELNIVIGAKVQILGDYLFKNCTITSLDMQSTALTEIGNSAFVGQTELTEITLPKSLTTINAYAFKECSSLTSIVFLDTYGWKVNSADINVSDASNNVTLLTSTYLSKKIIKDNTPKPPSLEDYSWSEIQQLARKKLSADEYKTQYGIEPGSTKTVNGVTYVLVDLGLDSGDYNGFVFMYNSKTTSQINNTETNYGGYSAANVIVNYMNSLYEELKISDNELYTVIKKVDIVHTGGLTEYKQGIYNHTMQNAALFLASVREVGFDTSEWQNNSYGFNFEGQCFDLFDTTATSRTDFMKKANIDSSWWLRSSHASADVFFEQIMVNGSCITIRANEVDTIVPCFVIG